MGRVIQVGGTPASFDPTAPKKIVVSNAGAAPQWQPLPVMSAWLLVAMKCNLVNPSPEPRRGEAGALRRVLLASSALFMTLPLLHEPVQAGVVDSLSPRPAGGRGEWGASVQGEELRAFVLENPRSLYAAATTPPQVPTPLKPVVPQTLLMPPGTELDPAALQKLADGWRAEHRLIDLHQHVDYSTQHLARAVKIMDAVGLGLAVNLDGDTVTPGPNGGPSALERNKALADSLHPGRFLHYMHLDYGAWDQPDFAERAARQIEQGHRLGAAGLKEFKRLGLYLRDGQGRLLKVDDAKLDPVWEKCGELGMPVSIHVADPKAFWMPFDEHNERWNELKDHQNWWFGDTNKYPAWKDLLESLNRVVARHPKTTFVCVHFANNAEELEWVEQSLDRYPNLMADLAARIPEIGRHDPAQVRRLFLKHQDRILFATDFMVYDRLILGSSGNEPPPTDVQAETFYAKHWRWLETLDHDWPHMTPIQGDWTISSIGLPASVLRKIYFDNARKLLRRSLPLPVVRAARIERDFKPDGDLSKADWLKARPARMEYASADSTAQPEVATTVRLLWSKEFLYLGYECPFTRLTVFDPPPQEPVRSGAVSSLSTRNAGGEGQGEGGTIHEPQAQSVGSGKPLPGRKRWNMDKQGVSLWDRDVVEAFIASDEKSLRRYGEFQVAPTNERLDLLLDLPKRDFDWNSGWESAVQVDSKKGVWTCEIRIPLSALSQTPPASRARWRINLFRCDRAHNAFMAWNPTLQGSFHVPERFGVLEFAGE